MKNYNIMKKKWLYLMVAFIIIATGCVIYSFFGFGESLETTGGWAVTMRLSGEYDYENVNKDEIYNYLISVFGSNAKLKEGEYSDGLYQIVSVYTDTPINISADDIDQRVNERYEGLLIEDWTKVHHLSPSLEIGNTLFTVIAISVFILLIFILVFLFMNFRCAAFVTIGIIINSLITCAIIIIVRIPVNTGLYTAIGTSVVIGISTNIYMLNKLNTVSISFPRKSGTRTEEGINNLLNSTVKNSCIYSAFITILFLVFIIEGLIFNANPSWYCIIIMLYISLLSPQLYSTFILPGFYSVNRGR